MGSDSLSAAAAAIDLFVDGVFEINEQ